MPSCQSTLSCLLPHTHLCCSLTVPLVPPLLLLLQVVSSGSLPANRVQHLAGGVYGWFGAGLPMVGEYDASAAGTTPNVTDVAR